MFNYKHAFKLTAIVKYRNGSITLIIIKSSYRVNGLGLMRKIDMSGVLYSSEQIESK